MFLKKTGVNVTRTILFLQVKIVTLDKQSIARQIYEQELGGKSIY